MPREALELEVPLRSQRVADQELRELVHLPRPEGDIDEGEPLEDLLLERLRPAPPHADHAFGLLALESARLPQVRDQAAIGRLADRAGVEKDQVGLLGLGRLAVSERLEHPLHPLGVVLVHLAPERGDVIALHGGEG